METLNNREFPSDSDECLRRSQLGGGPNEPAEPSVIPQIGQLVFDGFPSDTQHTSCWSGSFTIAQEARQDVNWKAKWSGSIVRCASGDGNQFCLPQYFGNIDRLGGCNNSPAREDMLRRAYLVSGSFDTSCAMTMSCFAEPSFSVPEGKLRRAPCFGTDRLAGNPMFNSTLGTFAPTGMAGSAQAPTVWGLESVSSSTPGVENFGAVMMDRAEI